MSLHGRKHRLVVSSTKQDTTTLEAVDIQLRPQSGHNQGASVTEFYRGSDETGGESHLEEVAPTPIAVDYSKPAQFAADYMTLLHPTYFCTQGTADTATEIDTNSAIFEHIWSGPHTNGAALSFSMEDQGDPAATDTDINRDVHNCTPSRVSISGARRGVMTVGVDIAGGFALGNADAQTAGTFHRTDAVNAQLYHFGMSHCFTEAVDYGKGALSTFFAGDLGSDTKILAFSHLGGTPVSLTSALQEVNIEMTQDLDLQRSMAPGNTTAAFAGYVPTGGDWVYGQGQQQVECEFVFNQNHSAGTNLVETLLAEYEAGTRRSWEYWLAHPENISGTSTGAHQGIKISMYQATPVSWAEENDGFGERYVRVRYRCGWNTTDDMGWHFAVASPFVTAMGAA